MTFKSSVALAAVLALALSSTTGFAAKKSNPEAPLTDSAMLSKTVWTAAKVVVLQQYLTKVAPKIESRLNAVDSSNGAATKFVMDAMVAGWFLNSMKDYFTDLRNWSWDSFGSPVANQLPEPIRSIVCAD